MEDKNNRGKRWTDEEENKLVELLREEKSLEECSNILKRTQHAIKLRIEEIIYKKIVHEGFKNYEINHLKKHVDLTIEEINIKYKNKYKNKIKKIESKSKNHNSMKDFEKNILIRLENIELNQKKIMTDILNEKNNEINKLKKEIDKLMETKIKNEKTIKELIINKI